MKKRNKGFALAGLSLLCLTALVISQSYMIFVAEKEVGDDTGKIPGSVGLRSYFDSGTGTETDPFIITRPIHFYNLGRLQALGAFPEQEYFQVGRIIKSTDATESGVTTDATELYVYGTDTGTYLNQTVLDMSAYTAESILTTVVSVGSTAAPFYGIFNGGNFTAETSGDQHGSIIINNLLVDSDPEDVGVFGYISSGAICKNVVFANLTVTNNGYKTNLEKMYNPDIAYSTLTGILKAGTSDIAADGTVLTTLGDGTFANLSATSYNFQKVTGLADTLTVSSKSYPITYAIRTTNDAIFTKATDDTTGITSYTLDTSASGALLTDDSYADFLTTTCVMPVRFYITGTVTIDNIKYAKIIATYYMTVKHTKPDSTPSGSETSSETSSSEASSTPTGTFDVAICRDCATDADDGVETDYTHNTNIGFIAGHTDGSIWDSYVYNGTFNINQSSSSTTNQACETDNGLIGEIGCNLYSNISPAIDYESAGDTGIINFTNIYNNIHSTDQTPGLDYGVQTSEGVNFYYFNEASDSLYSEFLRRRLISVNEVYYYQPLSNSATSVDFVGRKIITENGDHTRGLGIFQLNTTDTETNYVDSYLNGLGDFVVTNNSSKAYSNIYYETAELDATNGTGTYDSTFFSGINSSADVTSWKPGSSYSELNIRYGTSLPNCSFNSAFDSTSDDSLFSTRNFERKHDYIVNVPLTATSDTFANYYFSGTGNGFLRDYFTYKLRDKNGDQLKYTDTDFGLMIKEVSGTEYTNTTSFNSYLTITGNSGTISQMTGTDSDGVSSTVPEKTIEFNIENEKGANITVLAKSSDSNYLCIYDAANLDSSGADTTIGNYPSYAMYIPSPAVNDTNSNTMPYYFDYDITNNDIAADTSSKTYPYIEGHNTTTDRLYAHTFYIPKAGKFFLGTPSGSVDIYYIAVQGQNGKGDLGGRTTIYSSDTVLNMNFLLYDPTKSTNGSQSKSDLSAYIYVAAAFSAYSGTFNVGVSNADGVYGTDTNTLVISSSSTVSGSSSLTKALIENQKKSTYQFVLEGSSNTIANTYYLYNWA